MPFLFGAEMNPDLLSATATSALFSSLSVDQRSLCSCASRGYLRLRCSVSARDYVNLTEVLVVLPLQISTCPQTAQAYESMDVSQSQLVCKTSSQAFGCSPEGPEDMLLQHQVRDMVWTEYASNDCPG